MSEVELGTVLTAMLQAKHLAVDVVESYGRHDAMYASLSRGAYDVVLLSNTTLTPKLILEVAPVIQSRFPAVRIVVLSGWMENDFVVSLELLDVHDVFKMTEGIEAAVHRIAELVNGTNPMPRPTRP